MVPGSATGPKASRSIFHWPSSFWKPATHELDSLISWPSGAGAVTVDTPEAYATSPDSAISMVWVSIESVAPAGGMFALSDNMALS